MEDALYASNGVEVVEEPDTVDGSVSSVLPCFLLDWSYSHDLHCQVLC